MTDLERSRLNRLKDEPKGLKSGFGQLRERFGQVGAISIVVSLVLGATLALAWWSWEDLKKRPGVEWIVAQVGKKLSRGKRRF